MQKHIKDFYDWQTSKPISEGSFSDWTDSMVTGIKNLFNPSTPKDKDNTKPESEVKGKRPHGVEPDSMYFMDLDLRNEADLKKYAASCQKWINSRKPFFNTPEYQNVEDPALKTELEQNKKAYPPTPQDKLDGIIFAETAKKFQIKREIYLPWELAMAQATLEGGLSDTGKYPNGEITRPIITKNPFNVGNTDDGTDVYHQTLLSGIVAYYDKMTKSYLNVRTADGLLNNFVNQNSNRYASSTGYEKGLKDLIAKIKQTAA